MYILREEIHVEQVWDDLLILAKNLLYFRSFLFLYI